MNRCLKCNFEWTDSDQKYICPSCSQEVKMINGFRAYASDLAEKNEGFNPEAFEELYKYETTNFWFVSRNKLIIYLLKKHCAHMQNFLEIGCGTAFVSNGIRQTFPNAQITGSEIYTNGLAKALIRLDNSANLIQVDARELPFTEEFDVIGAFDVIEHIEEDKKVLSEIFRSLRPGGFAFISVPQHKFMWSHADVAACHVRRYDNNELQEKMEKAGFEIVRSTSFVSLLLPLMYFTRKSKNADSGVTIPAWQNRVLSIAMNIELFLIKCGINFPFGGSRFVLARK